MKKNCYVLILSLLFLISCKNSPSETEEQTSQNSNTQVKTEEESKKDITLDEQRIVFKNKLDSLETAYKAPINSEEEFENFKTKSNYIEVIDDKNEELLETYFNYINEDRFRPYASPTEVNGTEYNSNSFVFGDLNGDGLRDCVVTALRSDMYNEIHFFYVFINEGNSFKLKHIANEDDLAGFKEGGWPSLFRHQRIEDGYFKGLTYCHYNDAHCCPSMIFKTQAKFVDNELQFHSAEFVMDDPFIMQYRPTPVIDSVLVKSSIR